MAVQLSHIQRTSFYGTCEYEYFLSHDPRDIYLHTFFVCLFVYSTSLDILLYILPCLVFQFQVFMNPPRDFRTPIITIDDGITFIDNREANFKFITY